MKKGRRAQALSKVINFNIMAVFLVTSILVLWILTLTFVSAGNESNVIFEIDKTEANVGEIIRATVKVNNIKNLSGYQINIDYDPDIVKVVNPDTGSEDSVIVIGDLINNPEYGAIPAVSNDNKKGLLAIARIYVYMNEYKKSGKSEESGVLFDVGFKVLKKKTTEIKFTEKNLSNNINGTALYNWDGESITNYTVKAPRQKINLSASPTLKPSPDPNVDPTSWPGISDKESIVLTPEVNDNTGEAKVSAKKEDILTALDKAKIKDGVKDVVLNIESIEGAKEYIIELPTDLLSYNSFVHKILILTKFGIIEIPSNFFSQKGVPAKIANSSTIAFSIKTSNVEGLEEGLKNKIDTRPVIEFNILVGGEIIEWKSPSIPLKISIPYTAFSEQQQNYEYIVVWHIENTTNKVIPVTSGKYHISPLNMVKFITNNFGKFAVAHNHKTFDDIDSYSWAKNQIEVLASRGIINGTSETTFAPGEDITRADYIILLVKSLGLYSEIESNFSDVLSGSYYFEYVGIAKELGITSGVGNNIFKPSEKITRQDMMVLTANALKIAGKISNLGSESELAGFNDSNQIASYAIEGVSTLVKEGIVVGSENYINPLGNATRAELAAIIYKIYYM